MAYHKFHLKKEDFAEMQKIMQDWWNNPVISVKGLTLTFTNRENKIYISNMENISVTIYSSGTSNWKKSVNELFEYILSQFYTMIYRNILHIPRQYVCLDKKFYLVMTNNGNPESYEYIKNTAYEIRGYVGLKETPEYDAFIENAFAISNKIESIPHITQNTRATNTVAAALIDDFVRIVPAQFEKCSAILNIRKEMRKLADRIIIHCDNRDALKSFNTLADTNMIKSTDLSNDHGMLVQLRELSEYDCDIANMFHNIANFISNELMYFIDILPEINIPLLEVLLTRRENIGFEKMSTLYDLATKAQDGVPAFCIDEPRRRLYISLV